MRISEINGVPVFWQEAPGPLTAGLVFGCGTRDETFMTIGVTHLVEHLVMSTLPRTHHDSSATVDLFTTEFVATGRPDQVVAFLRTVCAGISAIPVDRLPQEVGVLDAEDGMATRPTAAALLTRRFGARDVGLETYAGPGLRQLSAADVTAHAARFFVAGNAALWLTGPPPDGLELRLPPGERVRRAEPAPARQDGPRWSREPVDASGVLLSGERDAAWNIAMSVLAERVREDARHQRGLSYEVFGDIFTTGPLRREYLIGADARPGEDGAVAEILWEHLRRLAEGGPTDAELAHEKEGFVETYDDPRWAASEVALQARAAVLDAPRTTPEERLREVAEVTREDVAAAVAGALPTALVAVPYGVTPSLPGMSEGGCPRMTGSPFGREFSMKTLVRLLAGTLRPSRLYVSTSGIALRHPDGDTHETAFADVIGIEYDGEMRKVFGANGCVLHVVPTAYRDDDVISAALDQFVPAALRFARGGGPVPAPSSLDAIAQTLAERPKWYRRASLLAAIGLGLATAVLYFDWRAGFMPLWTVIVGAVVTVGIGWDARPRRRRSRDLM